MVDAVLTPGRNVVDFVSYRQERDAMAHRAQAIRPLCRHCGAMLGDGDSDDDCSSAGLTAAIAPPRTRRMFAAE